MRMKLILEQSKALTYVQCLYDSLLVLGFIRYSWKSSLNEIGESEQKLGYKKILNNRKTTCMQNIYLIV